jgi:hypothetical protein
MADVPASTRRRPTARQVVLGIYLLAALFVSVQQGWIKPSNNFKTFRAASLNLPRGIDLYAAHPDQHSDFYKYSPTFAALFSPIAWLPFPLGVTVWVFLNAFAIWFAFSRLLPERQSTVALALVFVEVLLSLQYTQSNPLVAALIILAFVALEQGKQLQGALLIGVGASVKIFPLAALVFALFHPRRVRFGAIAIAVALAFIALPLLEISFADLIRQYHSWRAIEASDTVNHGYSVMEYLYLWIGVQWPNWPVQLVGTVLLLLPLAVRRSAWADPGFRRLFLSLVLVYVVVFNHMSEPATIVIAYAGVCLWYAGWPRTRFRTVLMVATLVVMSVHSLDLILHGLRSLGLVPGSFKEEVLVVNRVKGMPFLVFWVVIETELFRWPLASGSAPVGYGVGSKKPERLDARMPSW